MPRTPVSQVVTANALIEGYAVWLTPDGSWSAALEEAEVLTDEAEAQLRLLSAMAQTDRVVGVYLAEVAIADGRPIPTHFREAFRRDGPGAYALPNRS